MYLKNILKDYKEVQEKILEFMTEYNEGKRANFIVIHKHYLSPSVIPTKTLLHNPDGELQYFIGIRDALEHILAFGNIPRNSLPDHSPSYLCELAI